MGKNPNKERVNFTHPETGKNQTGIKENGEIHNSKGETFPAEQTKHQPSPQYWEKNKKA